MPSLRNDYVVLCDSCYKPIEGKSIIVNGKTPMDTWIYHESPRDCANAVEPIEIRRKLGWKNLGKNQNT